MKATDLPLIPRHENLEGWGMASQSTALVYRPTDTQGLIDAFRVAASRNLTVGLRGAGCSYGDAALNENGVVVDLSGMNRILEWDPHTGTVRCEPGVTISQLWRATVEAGFWPPVVPGTMAASIGGLAAANAHGKNNFKTGTIGDHIESFRLMIPSGEILECDRATNTDIFHAAIGGFGLLGCFIDLTLQLIKTHSGQVEVKALAASNLDAMFDIFEAEAEIADYMVGWIDGFAKGKGLGRGLYHSALYLPRGIDHEPIKTNVVANQELPSKIAGIMPKSLMWAGLRPFTNPPGMRLVNMVKYLSGKLQDGKTYRQPHAGFHFLLDYVPGWKRIYKPGGLIQFQCFVPNAEARKTFVDLIGITQKRKLWSYLCVMKKHRSDPFLMTHAVDGYSLAMDLPVTRSNRERVLETTRLLSRRAIESGGRFYFAKDSTLVPEDVREAFPKENLEQFAAIKRRVDPNGALKTDLSRRLFPEL